MGTWEKSTGALWDREAVKSTVYFYNIIHSWAKTTGCNVNLYISPSALLLLAMKYFKLMTSIKQCLTPCAFRSTYITNSALSALRSDYIQQITLITYTAWYTQKQRHERVNMSASPTRNWEGSTPCVQKEALQDSPVTLTLVSFRPFAWYNTHTQGVLLS